MRISRLLIPLAVLPALVISCTRDLQMTADSQDTAQVPSDAIPGQLMIKLEKPLEEALADGLDLSSLGECTITRSIPDGTRFDERHRKADLHLWYTVEFDPSISLTKAGSDLEGLSGIAHVEYMVPVRRADVTYPFNDPDFTSEQWDFYNDGSESGFVAGADINVLPAWQYTTGSSNVIVAVCDAAVDYEHEDLADNIWINEAEYYGEEGVDDDGNGYIDDIYGYNFVTYSGGRRPLVVGDHGTHIAGTIAAVNNNGKGISGIAGGDGTPGSGVRIMSNQISDGNRSSNIAGAIIYAADNGAVLMNCSWELGGIGVLSVREAIDYFNEYAGMDENGEQEGPMAGGLTIFAAGNSSTTSSYPAMEKTTIAVASIDPDYTKSYYSNYGTWVDICAPGGDGYTNEIYSTLPGSEYGSMSGTSMACPHVVGVAALVVSRLGGPGFTRQNLIDILLNTSNPIVYDYNSSYSGRLGEGLVDACAAVTASVGTPAPVTELSGSTAGASVKLRWTVPSNAEGCSPQGYRIFWSTETLSGLDPASPATGIEYYDLGGQSTAESGSTLEFSVNALSAAETYHLTIASYNVYGELSSAHPGVTVTTGANFAPEITPLDGTSLQLSATGSGSLRFNLTDVENHSLSYTAELEGSGAIPGMQASMNGSELTLFFDAMAMDDGTTYSCVLHVNDGYDTTSQGFTVTVAENLPPMLNGGQPGYVLNSLGARAIVNLTEIIVDPEGYAVEFSLAEIGDALLAAITDGVLEVVGRSYGSSSVTVRATDPRGEYLDLVIPVVVRSASVSFDLYPNPFVSTLNIRVPEAQTADVTISNKAGAVVYSASAVELDPFNPLQVDLGSEPGGLYYVNIKSDSIDATLSVAKR